MILSQAIAQLKFTKQSLRFGLKYSLLSSSILFCLQHGHAQQQSAIETENVVNQKDVVQLETVVVTATRREQSLQKVPVAVSILGGRDLDEKQQNSLEAIVKEVPSVNFNATSTNKDSSLFIRGIGTISTSPGVEPSVSTVIDGVVLSRPGQATLDLLDIDRIEVLRGPQGTLFGKNSTAGVVSIVTKNPTEHPSGYVDAYLTDDHEQRIKLGASGALIPGILKANVNALLSHYEGNVYNYYSGKNVNGYTTQGVRSKFEYNPSDNLTLGLSLDYVHKESNAPLGVLVSSDNTDYIQTIAPVVASQQNRTVNSREETVNDTNQGISLSADWFLDQHQISSITALRQWKNVQSPNYNYLPQATTQFALLYDRGEVDSRQFSQELRIASLGDGFVNYVAGLYFSKNNNDEKTQRYAHWYDTGTQAYADDYALALFGTKSTNYAVFGEGTWNLSDRLRLITGLRITRDELSYYHQRNSTIPAALVSRNSIRSSVANSGSTSETGVSGRTGVQFDISSNINTYFTYSRGYKGPAYNVYFNMRNIDTPVIDPETSNSYELGLKSQWLNNKLRLNLAAFYTEYENYQANFRVVDSGGGISTRLINAGEVSTKGIELDGTYQINPNLRLNLAVANIRARIDHFQCPPADSACPNVNGKPLPNSPDWKLNAQVSRYIPIANNRRIELSSQYSWQSKTQFDIGQNEQTIQPPYGIWNASIGLNDTASDWKIALLIRNVLNKSYNARLATASYGLFRNVPRDDERYFGLSFRKDF
ncbi:TonB-dependent receptor [Acinetobacter qingfengensis]|uniref:TonB-dependent receptor n=1 Tax=Acinetobacter qingfengensis TaxID=1262585 RepID=A0A1E7QWJ8_9GAMM|nr:TonB-dependent receptor [Acinetobacter qingfengensis]KAA8731265.1 TonB-dependent receptor [Acinetobacter qingfengensis]OEY91488.1 TonB-dependent receptor [Acinetobacter qingfengensis]